MTPPLTEPPAGRGERLNDTLIAAFGGGAFPAFVLACVVLFTALLGGLLLVPAGAGAVGAFSADFRVWCFGFDPARRAYEWSYLVMLFVNPFILCTVVLAVWWVPLRAAWRAPRALRAPLGAALLVVAVTGAGFAAVTVRPGAEELPFPAERLRTAQAPPDFTLTDHTGARVVLSALRGRVVLLTAVYATCGYTCPMILGQARRAVAALPPELSTDLQVLAVTLDPAHDDRVRLAAMASGQDVDVPMFHLLTGPVDVVEHTLDRFSITRSRNPETGQIDHQNLFILIDRQGRIAYRLGLGERQERWLVTALSVLLREPTVGG